MQFSFHQHLITSLFVTTQNCTYDELFTKIKCISFTYFRRIFIKNTFKNIYQIFFINLKIYTSKCERKHPLKKDTITPESSIKFSPK